MEKDVTNRLIDMRGSKLSKILLEICHFNIINQIKIKINNVMGCL